MLSMHKRGVCRHAVSIYVCVSVTFVDCVKTNKHSIKIFSPSGNQIILVLRAKRHSKISDGNPPPPPLTVASNAGGVCKDRDSEPMYGLTACVNTATGQVL